MRVVINQPRYLPVLSYLRRIAEADLFILLDTVPLYRGFENRAIIADSLRRPDCEIILSVPLSNSGRRMPYDPLPSDRRWLRKHQASITQVYSKAAHWPEGAKLLEQHYGNLEREYSSFLHVGMVGLSLLRFAYGVTTPVVYASQLRVPYSKGPGYLVRLLKTVEATEYVSGQGGRNYITNPKLFTDAGVKLTFDESYTDDPHASRLSAIHYLLTQGPTFDVAPTTVIHHEPS